MFKVSVTYEGKKTAEEIQRKFRGQLSEKEILKTTAGALNVSSRRAINNAKRQMTKNYTINKKYFDRIGKLTKPAKGEAGKLYAESSYIYGTIPLAAFKFTDKNKPGYNLFRKSNGGVVIEVQKGRQKLLKYAFVKTMKSGHTGIFALGYYSGKKFVPALKKTGSGKMKITEIKTVSPFSIVTSARINKVVGDNVAKTMPPMLQAMLQRKLDKALK